MNRKPTNLFISFSIAIILAARIAIAADAPVKVWEEQLVIPTYLIGQPDPNPQFYFGGASQGAEHHIYPYPLYDNLTTEKVDKSYKMVYLENEYLKIGILPEIGGKIFEAIDKTNGYNFFYRQHVIKPALISLLGAWISGGVEWDVPHHHRATSFLPVQYTIEHGKDGSQSVWVGELELRDRMRWAVGITLHPGKSYVEASFRIINRTPLPTSMLCFSNVAVHVDDTYQVIFPPSTQHVTYHAKRDFTTWPIATTRFNNADFTAGVDVSWYKNHISSMSMFAWNYQDDFFAGYDHGKHAGTMSIADHNAVPGKKFWTWGNGPRGRMQDTLLTDSDGPYIELMVGAYSDNQPDYTWLAPYETRSWTQYWYPFREIDGVKNANTEAAVNLDVKDGKAKFGFAVTSDHPQATAWLKLKDQTLASEQIAINPAKPYTKEIAIPSGADEHDLRAGLTVDGKELVAYSPIKLAPEPMPQNYNPPPNPDQIKTNEELYLAGLRIDAFHNPQLEPEPYWEEALKRDPGDVRVNTVLAVNYIKKARYMDAEKLLRAAVARATASYTMPKDGEPFYYLGLALKAQGKIDEADQYFQKSTWSAAWRSPGYFESAQIASMRGDLDTAIAYADRAIQSDTNNIRALTFKSGLLCRIGREDEARATYAAAAKIDPLDEDVLAVAWMLDKNPENTQRLMATLNAFPATALEAATECMDAGRWDLGKTFLSRFIDAAPDKSKVSPLVYYTLAYFAQKLNQPQEAAQYDQLAAKASTDYAFPFQREMIDVLESAMKSNPADSHAPYYLGNLLYDWQPDRAVGLWEQSVTLGAEFPVVYRNLASVYTRNNNSDKALAMLEKAAQLGGNAMVFRDLDQLYEEGTVSPDKRLALMEQHQKVIDRDDVIAREINLKIFAGKADEAINLLKARVFHTWEGGGQFAVGDSWTNAMLLRGQQHLAAKQFKEAFADFQSALTLPPNLQEATIPQAREPEVNYWLGVAYAGLGDGEKAKQAWRQSADAQAAAGAGRGGRGGGFGGRGGGGRGAPAPTAGTRVVEAVPYYQAMSLLRLGEKDKANTMFQQLAKSDSQQQNPRAAADAHYLAGLGYLGLNDNEKARQELNLAMQSSPDHLGAKLALSAIR